MSAWGEQIPEWGEPKSGASEWNRTVECSGRITLECGCGERLILIGLEEDWRSEQRTDFGCQCGKGLNLSNRLREEVFEFGRLMRGAFTVVPGGRDAGRPLLRHRDGKKWGPEI